MTVKATYLLPHPPLLIPEIGKGEEKKINKTIQSMYHIVEKISEIQPDTMVFITPHGPLFQDAITIHYSPQLKGDFKGFRINNIHLECRNDLEFVEFLDDLSFDNDIPVALVDDQFKKNYQVDSRLDHGVTVPLYFFKKASFSAKVVVITYGLLDEISLYRFGQLIQSTAKQLQRKIVVIASGDLSHKLTPFAPAGYSDKGIKFDEIMMQNFKSDNRLGFFSMQRDFIEEVGECGLRSVQIMLGTVHGLKTKNQVLSYEGPFGVGYGCVMMDVEGVADMSSFENEIKNIRLNLKVEAQSNESEPVRIARKSLETWIAHKRELRVDELGENTLMTQKSAGVFVSLKKHGELRGCIGTIYPQKTLLVEEIIQNAISAGCYDPRFSPLTKEEMTDLVYSVDILSEPEEVEDKSKLDPSMYGVIVAKDHKKGLLLPNLEGIDSVEEQLNVALRKAGIHPWESYQIFRFKVERYQ